MQVFIKWKVRCWMIKVLKAGLFSIIQDLGRYGYQEFGVPYSGVMDRQAANISNALLGNNENDAVIEITMTGPTLEFECDTLICITGADMSPKLNDSGITNNQVVKVKSGDTLSFGELKYGFRAYLAVLGGFQSEMVMNSRSMYKGITLTHQLLKGDYLKIKNFDVSFKSKNAILKVDNKYLAHHELQVYKGPEFDLLSVDKQAELLNRNFTISKSNNRMAYQLNESFENDLAAIITSPVLPGTVQLTPSGKLIVLMRDCQTTGGYPRVLQLKTSALDVLSQKLAGMDIIFKLNSYS